MDDHYRLGEPVVAKDPGAYFEDLRTQCPVAHSDKFDGFWIMSRYKDVYDALLDPDMFSSASRVTLPVLPKSPVPVLEQDEPDHRKYRRPIQGWFTARKMAALEPRVREAVTQCIDPVVADGKADLVEVLASPIPPIVIALLMGLPEEDWDWFGEHGSLFLKQAGAGDMAGSEATIRQIRRYLADALELRRKTPTDDMLTDIVNIRIDDEPISDSRAVELAEVILGAGHITTVGGIGGLLYHVARNAETRDRLASDPKLIENAVEEAVRLEAPIMGQGRMITRNVSASGMTMPAGDRIMLMLGAANRDPEVYENAEEFRIDRSRNSHLGFGAGIHRCVGAPLARLEMRVVLEEVLRRMPGLRLEDEESVQVEYVIGREFTSLRCLWEV